MKQRITVGVVALLIGVGLVGCGGTTTKTVIEKVQTPPVATKVVPKTTLQVGPRSSVTVPSYPSNTATGSVAPENWGRPIPFAPLTGPRASASGTATMFDSITLSVIPSNPFAVAGYTSGNWPTYETIRHTWPHAHAISIAISASNHADCLDVEPGDASPSQAAAWVKSDIAAGFKKPCVYSSLWEYVNQVRPALAAGGISRSQVFEWDADYNFVPHIDSGFDATQWTDHYNGLNLDASMVTLNFLSIAQPPYGVTPPPPTPVCFGSHAQNTSFCRNVKNQVNSLNQDKIKTWNAGSHLSDAMGALGCHPRYKRKACIALANARTVLLRDLNYDKSHAAALQKKYS